jgi:chromosome segregation ATPase
MSTQIDTIIGNKRPSEKLKGMLVGLKNNTEAILDSIDEIKAQARSEGFEDHESDLLIRHYLGMIKKTKRQIRYFLKEIPRAKEQKKLKEKLAEIGTDANMQEEETITLPTEHKILPQDLEEITQEQQEQEDTEPEPSPSEELKTQEPDYIVEDLKIQLDNANGKITELTTQNKTLEEKYKQ